MLFIIIWLGFYAYGIYFLGLLGLIKIWTITPLTGLLFLIILQRLVHHFHSTRGRHPCKDIIKKSYCVNPKLYAKEDPGFRNLRKAPMNSHSGSLNEISGNRIPLENPQSTSTQNIQYPISNIVFIFIISIIFLLYSIGLFFPETSFDSIWYHFPLAQIYANTGKIAKVPELLYSTMPRLGEMFFVPGYLINSQLIAKLVNFAFIILYTLIAYLFSKTLLCHPRGGDEVSLHRGSSKSGRLSKKTKPSNESFIHHESWLTNQPISRSVKLKLSTPHLVALLTLTQLVIGWQSTSGYIDIIRAVFELAAFSAFWLFISHSRRDRETYPHCVPSMLHVKLDRDSSDKSMSVIKRSFWSVVKWSDRIPSGLKYLLYAAILSGLALSTKFHSLLPLIACITILIVHFFRHPRGDDEVGLHRGSRSKRQTPARKLLTRNNDISSNSSEIRISDKLINRLTSFFNTSHTSSRPADQLTSRPAFFSIIPFLFITIAIASPFYLDNLINSGHILYPTNLPSKQIDQLHHAGVTSRSEWIFGQIIRLPIIPYYLSFHQDFQLHFAILPLFLVYLWQLKRIWKKYPYINIYVLISILGWWFIPPPEHRYLLSTTPLLYFLLIESVSSVCHPRLLGRSPGDRGSRNVKISSVINNIEIKFPPHAICIMLYAMIILSITINLLARLYASHKFLPFVLDTKTGHQRYLDSQTNDFNRQKLELFYSGFWKSYKYN